MQTPHFPHLHFVTLLQSQGHAVQALPAEQKALLWLGIALDVSSKVGLCVSLGRFAHRRKWMWFGATLAFFTLSSAVCVMYWITHYPAAALDQDHRESRSKLQRADLHEARVHGACPCSNWHFHGPWSNYICQCI